MAQVQDNENANMRQIQQVNDGNEVNNVQQEEALQPGIAITASAMTLWDYAQTIVQDDREHAQNHPHEARPPHPPVPMSRRDRCIVTLMIEDKRDELRWQWEELNEIELLLGLGFV
ncbi:hypothetical protein BD769DRAFT_1673700 [Suillus cothurnatus]|nr:hypothetical protein BD769DRAFT_1673700 [Suillus cothurnatus]